MDTILKVIDTVTTDKQVKSIINSINDNQEKSKNWLVEKSIEYFTFFDKPKICIAAGWYGHLADKLKHYTKEKVLSFDKDPNTKFIGNKLYKDVWFKVMSIEDFNFKKYDIVICTSCEHLEQKVIDDMFKTIKKGTLVILQSNNYIQMKDHINCHNNVVDFEKTLKEPDENGRPIKLDKILYSGTLKLDKFDRYMVVGIK
tara:strand:- start:33 stop:632 length:600 start_codon:yes stop_codon:yes gene_type:complete